MTDLRDPHLRFRDVNRLVARDSQNVHWEPGSGTKNEWVYASLESNDHRGRLLEWLRSKNVPASAESFLFWSGESQLVTVRWREIIETPEKFLGERNFRIVSKDRDWILEYMKESVVRFGRLPAPSKKSLP